MAACLVLGGAACGSDDEAEDEPAEETGDTETTEADDADTTEADDTEETDDASGEVVEAEDVTWDLNASEYRGQDGTLVAFDCEAGGEIGSVWGTEVYTDDSSVCSAAVHAGLIDVEDGGRVIIRIAPGEESYEGSEANGVTSSEYGPWGGSFTFPTS